MDKDTLQLILDRFDKLEEKMDKRFDSHSIKFDTESAFTRQDREQMKKDIHALKTRFAVVAISLGMAGGKIAEFLPFLK